MSCHSPLLKAVFILWAMPKRGQTVLLYPENTVLQFTFGISVPISQIDKGGIAFSWAFQLNYVLPSNLTQLTLSITESGRLQDFTLKDIYQSIEKMFEEYSRESGRECLLRTICELAATPFDRSNLDEMGEIIHLLFTPSEDFSENVPSDGIIAKVYHEAENYGKVTGKCGKRYRKCTKSPLDLITKTDFQ